MAAARAAAERLRELRPDFESTYVATDVERWFYNAPELAAKLLDCFEKAGLDMPGMP